MNIEMANRMYNYRKQSGLSQEELADKLGISRQSVSKWERAEACPDTDNLIKLSKLYGVSIDTLLNVDPDEVITDSDETEETHSDDNASAEAGESTGEDRESIKNDEANGISFNGGIHIVDGEDKVKISPSGIHVTDGNDEVHIGWSGIKIKEGGSGNVHISFGGKGETSNNSGDYSDDSHADTEKVNTCFKMKDRRRKYLKDIPIGLIIAIVYIIIGTAFNLWHPGWILFLCIPVIHSIINAIVYKSIRKFNYPVFIVALCLFVGCVYNFWHPGWAAFLTIPLFYWIF